MTADDPWGPPSWIFGDTPEPDSVYVTLQLDYADEPERWVPVAQRWHDELAAVYAAAARGTAEPPILRFASRHDGTKVRRPASWAAMLAPDVWKAQQQHAERPGAAVLMFGLTVNRFAERHLMLTAHIDYPREAAGEVLPLVVDALHRAASGADPAYGEMGPGAGADPPNSALDLALWRWPESADASRAHLRGYAWITICPRELAARLDPARLGLFAEVRRLEHGGLLLQATPSPDDYGPDRVRAAFLALAAVLPPGLARARQVPGLERVVLADASRYATHAGGPVPDADLPLLEPPRPISPEKLAAMSAFAASAVAENLIAFESADDIIPEYLRESLAGHVKPVLTEEGQRRFDELRETLERE